MDESVLIDVPRLRITVAPARVLMRLRSWVPGRDTATLAGLHLPATVGHIVQGALRVLCVGPGEWLVAASTQAFAPIRTGWNVAEEGLACVDLSDAFAGFSIERGAAAEMLSKGCALDVHPRRFPIGRCARTRFAQIAVLIESTATGFDLHAARSHQPYLRSWLIDAAGEYR